MALTFTTTTDAATGGAEDVGVLLWAALGCNLAWGLVDAVMYLMDVLTDRGRDLVTARTVREAATPSEAHHVLREVMPPVVASILAVEDLERVRLRLARMERLPDRPRLTGEDWRGAVAVFLLVFLSTLPIVVPFLVIDDVRMALRASNGVAIVMLFGCGYAIAKYGGYRPWRTGAGMVVIGVVLVAITIALGG
jgi:VIT1/CCC1 family predicted Fe2+/Mn2+ transporter